MLHRIKREESTTVRSTTCPSWMKWKSLLKLSLFDGKKNKKFPFFLQVQSGVTSLLDGFRRTRVHLFFLVGRQRCHSTLVTNVCYYYHSHAHRNISSIRNSYNGPVFLYISSWPDEANKKTTTTVQSTQSSIIWPSIRLDWIQFSRLWYNLPIIEYINSFIIDQSLIIQLLSDLKGVSLISVGK